MQYSVRKSRIHANMSCESDVSPLNKYLITCYLILGKKKKFESFNYEFPI